MTNGVAYYSITGTVPEGVRLFVNTTAVAQLPVEHTSGCSCCHHMVLGGCGTLMDANILHKHTTYGHCTKLCYHAHIMWLSATHTCTRGGIPPLATML